MFQSIADSDTFSAPPARHGDESTLFRDRHPHVLVMGLEASLSPALARLGPHLRGPISHWRPAVATDPPRVTKGALIIWGVDRLSLEQQHDLLAWMNGPGANVQIISLAERPVFPLVWRQAVLDDLYYRLNMVCVALDDHATDSRPTLF